MEERGNLPTYATVAAEKQKASSERDLGKLQTLLIDSIEEELIQHPLN